MTVVDILLWLVPLVLGALVGWAFAQFGDTLRNVKKIYEGEPIWSILAGAAVMIAESVWSGYDGEAQFNKACEMVSRWLGGKLSPGDVERVVQRAYDVMKKLLGEHWDAIKLDIAEEAGEAVEIEGMQ